jgi:DNA excision repair protein ERCC-6
MDQDVKNERNGSVAEPKPETPQDTYFDTSDQPQSAESEQNPVTSEATDEASRLKELHADVRDQDALERDITRQVCSFRSVCSPFSIVDTFVGGSIAHGTSR